ncbi:hypothetical protein D3C85_1710750 [compost metagenome]
MGAFFLMQPGVAAGGVQQRGADAALQRALPVQVARLDIEREGAGAGADALELHAEEFEQRVVQIRVHIATLMSLSRITRCQRASSRTI